MSPDHSKVTRGPAEFGWHLWFIVVFLGAVFFVTYHDISHAQTGAGNYNSSADDLMANVAAGSLVRRIALSLLGVGATVSLICGRPTRPLRINGPLAWLVVGLGTWAFLSSLWAVNLSLTFKKLVEFGILGVAAIAAVRHFSVREIIIATWFTTAAFLVIGVFAELAYGNFKPLLLDYRFSGTLHPNGTGVECGLLIISAVAAADIERRWRALFRFSVLFGLALLILTGSRTSLAASLLCVFVYLASVSRNPKRIVLALSLSVILCPVLLFVTLGSLPGLESSIGRGRDDPLSGGSLTDRVILWEDLGYYIQQRPVLGYGYGGFWSPSNITAISDEEKWGVPNGHSAYVEYVLTLGIVGLIAFTFTTVAGTWRAFRLNRHYQDCGFAFCGAVLLFCVVDGLLESLIVDGSILEFLWMVVLARLALLPANVARRCMCAGFPVGLANLAPGKVHNHAQTKD